MKRFRKKSVSLFTAIILLATSFTILLSGCDFILDLLNDDEYNYTLPTSNVNIEQATVVRVIDGDTIEVDITHGSDAAGFANTGERRTIRFIGIDAPEATGGNIEPFGPEATEHLRTILPVGRAVYLKRVVGANYDGDNTSVGNRLRRHVWLTTPSFAESRIRTYNVGALMLLAGYAVVTGTNIRNHHRDFFVTLQQEATAANYGKWAAA
ncbi:MAG: thermonuclease family protein [Firmicutes bacterium]|nr:thermonuclease family protein [Bacillota bacterium]